MKSINKTYWGIWQLSLGSFVLAALTGFLYRYGMLNPLHGFLDLVNIRHAHSHLMFFNWISPPLMAWMVSLLGEQSDVPVDHKKYKTCLYTMLVLGLLAYPFFLLYGYRSTSIGSADLPIAAILSGIIMITWYWFAWLYYMDRKKAADTLPISIFDGALVALLISSLGAWGVSIFQFSGTHNPLVSSALTHFFLGVFTEGWAILGVLGIIWSYHDKLILPFKTGWLWKPLLLGSLLLFPLSLNQSLVTPIMMISAKTGLLLVVISLSLHLYTFVCSRKFQGFICNFILILLGVKIVFQFIAILPLDIWPGEHGLRILYLHLLLLGFVSLTFIKTMQKKDQEMINNFFAGAVLMVLLSLVVISGYWPVWLTPSAPYYWVMVIAILPALPAGWLLIKSLKKRGF